MLLRVPIATAAGAIIWFLETLMSYYADFITAILSFIFGAAISGLVAALFAGLILALIRNQAWDAWRKRGWIAFIGIGIGVLLLCISRSPGMVLKGMDPEFNEFTVYYAHPMLWLTGWLIVISSIVANTWIGFVGDRRWF